MQETSYRNYRIRYHKVTEWFAHVYRPGENKRMSDIPKASLAEGEAVLLSRARAIVDREEAAKTEGDKRNQPKT
jgi:hypothetical protein